MGGGRCGTVGDIRSGGPDLRFSHARGVRVASGQQTVHPQQRENAGGISDVGLSQIVQPDAQPRGHRLRPRVHQPGPL